MTHTMTHTITQATPNCSPFEALSALADGELDTRITLNDLQQDQLQAHWDTFQTIGDVLKGPAFTSAGLVYGADPAFLQRLALRLADERIEEPVMLTANTAGAAVAKPDALAANDTTFRWKVVAGLTSFGMAAVAALNFVGLPGSKFEPLLAQDKPGTELVVASPLGLMVRDARLEELLSAHKQLGGTALQAPSGFRNAGFESTPGNQR